MVPTAKQLSRRMIPQQAFDRGGKPRLIVARNDEEIISVSLK